MQAHPALRGSWRCKNCEVTWIGEGEECWSCGTSDGLEAPIAVGWWGISLWPSDIIPGASPPS